VPVSAERSVFEAYATGQDKYKEYIEERLLYGRKSIRETLPKTNLELFVSAKARKNADKLKITELRHDSSTFCKLYIASQIRAGDVDDFFAHENSRYPRSISDFGKLRKAKNKV